MTTHATPPGDPHDETWWLDEHEDVPPPPDWRRAPDVMAGVLDALSPDRWQTLPIVVDGWTSTQVRAAVAWLDLAGSVEIRDGWIVLTERGAAVRDGAARAGG